MPTRSPSVGPRADETWSPDSHDLVAQLPALLARMAADGIAVRRIMFNPADWDVDVPRRTSVEGRMVKLGAFNYQPRRSVVVIDDDPRNRVTLLLADEDGATGGTVHRTTSVTAHDPDSHSSSTRTSR